VDQCCKEKAECEQSVKDLRELAKVEGIGYCIDARTMVHIGDTNKTSELEHEHLVECLRCARIGQYIANMPNPATPQKRVSMSLAG